jgi:hypothetical protein
MYELCLAAYPPSANTLAANTKKKKRLIGLITTLARPLVAINNAWYMLNYVH